MTNPWVAVAVIVTLAVLYFVLQAVVVTVRSFRSRTELLCHERGRWAEVGVDALLAGLTGMFWRPRFRVTHCSLWPTRNGCARSCIHLLGAKPPTPLPPSTA
ncbi:MAG: hypothetical protein HY726_17935 [Candidatus Rokubacteria bacterium]|nr:hypothetical protein [Candidatus Rokubacteria bacterium]